MKYLAEQILDMKSSVPRNEISAPIPIPPTPIGISAGTIKYSIASGTFLQADLGMFLNPFTLTNRVVLSGTIGIQSSSSPVAQVIIRIFKSTDSLTLGTQIFSTQLGIEGSFEGSYTTSFETTDFNIANQFSVYNLTIEVASVGAPVVNVVGPVTFQGIAYGSID